MAKIKLLKAKEIPDSKGKLTVEVLCELESGAEGVAFLASGTSVGVYETAGLLAPPALGKWRLGANALLAVSYAFARACAKELGLELFEYIGKIAENEHFILPVPA